MAVKRKSRTRARPKARAKKAVAPKKAVLKKPVRKTKPAPKRKATPKPKTKVVRKPVPKPAPKPAEPPPGERIGVVTHYYNHLAVAIVKLETGTLRVGDTVHFKGHTSDFRQPVESLQIEHAQVQEVRAGDEFGLKVREHAREHDVLYKVVPS